jgi:hypothetical protein
MMPMSHGCFELIWSSTSQNLVCFVFSKLELLLNREKVLFSFQSLRFRRHGGARKRGLAKKQSLSFNGFLRNIRANQSSLFAVIKTSHNVSQTLPFAVLPFTLDDLLSPSAQQ